MVSVPDDVSFQFIRGITDDFSEEPILGQGAFGVVYRVRFGHAQFMLTTVICLANKKCVVFRNDMILLCQCGQQQYSQDVVTTNKTNPTPTFPAVPNIRGQVILNTDNIYLAGSH